MVHIMHQEMRDHYGLEDLWGDAKSVEWSDAEGRRGVVIDAGGPRGVELFLMRIELLTTGTELLLGTTQNTHGAWIGQRLFGLGLRQDRQVTVPDGQPVTDAIRDAVEVAEVLIVTGGLGPTSDDLTREAVAEVLGLELMEDEHAVRTIEEFFAKRGRKMAPANRKQALVPVGAEILANPNGTAPGTYIPPRLSGGRNCAVFLLPGPPREMYPMFDAEVVPRLEALVGLEQAPEMRELKFVGIGESDFHQGVDALLEAVDGLEHGYCARIGEVDLRLIGDAGRDRDWTPNCGRSVRAQLGER